MKPNKYCKTCNTETVRYDSGKCKPCCNRRDSGFRRLPKDALTEEVARPGIHLEGTLHGKIHGGQGAVRPSPRRGCSLS